MSALRSSMLDPRESFFPGDYQPYTNISSQERSPSYYVCSAAAAGARLLTQAPMKELLLQPWQEDILEQAREDFVQEHVYFLLQQMSTASHRRRVNVEVTQKGHLDIYCMSIDAQIGATHTGLRSALMYYHALPNFPNYSVARGRLKTFATAEENWDGFGGIPALPDVVEEVEGLMDMLSKESVPEPSLAMGGDGSIALFWSNNEYYVSLEVDGSGEYIYLITKDKEFLCDGDSRSEYLDVELKKHLKKIFTDEYK